MCRGTNTETNYVGKPAIVKKMEETSITISKNAQLPLAENYDLLRAKGFDAVQELGNSQWTDYNAHDPGITLLEALTYALTELRYRTGIDIADILTEPSGYISFRQALFTARRILTNNPLTVNAVSYTHLRAHE